MFEPTQQLPVNKLVNQITDMMEEAGVTLADLLEDLPKIREEIYQERLLERETAVAESRADIRWDRTVCIRVCLGRR